MKFVSNHIRAIAKFPSSLFKAVLSSRSQTNGVVSSTKLQISISVRGKNESFRQILNKSDPKTDHCGTPWVSFDQELKEELLLTCCQQSER